MSAVKFADPPVTPSAWSRPFRYTLERYHAAIEAGILTENDKVELIFNELLEKMPIGKRHADCVDMLMLYFVIKFGKQHQCRAQNPVTLLGHSEPEPDFAVVNRETYATRSGQPLAEDVLLLVEVSDSTLEYDRNTKSTLYALAGIPEYWIINLQQDQVEVHLQPDTTGGTYNSIHRYPDTATFESPFCGKVSVADLLPTT